MQPFGSSTYSANFLRGPTPASAPPASVPRDWSATMSVASIPSSSPNSFSITAMR